jgi:hypothetical protein
MARYLDPVVAAFDGWRKARSLAPQLLPDLRISARDGSAGRHRSRARSSARVRLLRDALEVPAHALSVLRRRRAASRESSPSVAKRGCASITASRAAATSRPTSVEGDEALFLADWSSLHLDQIAQDRGLKRVAASLYEFELG